MSRYRQSYRRTRRQRPESRTAADRQAFSEAVAGIDKEVEIIFLALPTYKLDLVFQLYGQQHGKRALTYAKRTYALWQSGSVRMSGEIAQRLLNFVPIVLDTETRYKWVRKLRSMYLHKVHRKVSCTLSNWFKRVTPVVADVINSSSRFQLPAPIIEKINWLTEGDALAAQKILAAAEMDEANVRTQFLAVEYHTIS